MKRVLATLLSSAAVLGLAAGSASAQVGVPDAFGLQGFIHTQSGAPYDGTASIEVRIYDAETAGTLLFTETISDVAVAGSRFAVEVGAGGTFPTGAYTTVTELFSQLPEVYVAVAIDGNAELPRQRMMTAAFSFRSEVSNGAWNLLCADCVGTGHLQDASVTAGKLGVACAEGEVLKNIGGTWTCATDDNTTDVVAGDGIDYTAGVVSIASTNCATGEVLKRNAANDGWECATDAGALGSVTSLAAGSGLSVDSPTGDVTVSLSPPTATDLGGVLAGQCANPGEVVAGYDLTGAAICVQDTDTTYGVAAGEGLQVTGTDFGIADDGVTDAMIADGAVGADQIADGSITAADLAPGAISAVQSSLQLNFNARFEQSPQFESWTLVTQEPNTNAPLLDADTPDGSTSSVLLSSTTNTDAAALASSKIFGIKEGSSVTLDLWVSHAAVFPNGGYGSRVVATFYDVTGTGVGDITIATADADLAWENKTMTMTAPVGAVAVGITDVSIDALTIGEARYDNIKLFASSPDLAQFAPHVFPQGSVMMFQRDACPPGWSVLTEAAGRTVVGLGAAGTVTGTVGAPLADLEDRVHTHDVNPANDTTTSNGGHNHSVDPTATPSTSNGDHTHSVNPPATTSTSTGSHAHSVNPPNTTSTSAGSHTHNTNPASVSVTDVHNHLWAQFDGSTSADPTWHTWDFSTSTDNSTDGGRFILMQWGDGMDSSGGGHYPLSRGGSYSGADSFYTNDDSHTHTVDIANTTSTNHSGHTHATNIASFNSASTGDHTHSTNVGSFNSASNGGHTHTVDIASFNSGNNGAHTHELNIPNTTSSNASTSVVLPYVQLLICRKD